MTRQERAAAKARKGTAKAEEIIQATVEAVTGQGYADERLPTASDAEYDLASQIRGMRDAGVSWWAIAQDLELPGAGDSAATGKKGAGKARAAYAKAFGKHPASFVRGAKKGMPERNENVTAVQRAPKAARRAAVRQGHAVLDLSLTDEELVEMLRGRKIAWSGVSEALQCTIEGEATVHPKYVSIKGEGSERLLDFREQHTGAPIEFRLFPAHARTVRLVNIYSVK